MRNPFCTSCDNMMYLNMKQAAGKGATETLEYYCRCCKKVEPIENQNMVVPILKTSVQNRDTQFHLIVNEYTKHDPTLPRIDNIPCPNPECPVQKHKEIIYLRYDDAHLKYLYVCTECDFVWSR